VKNLRHARMSFELIPPPLPSSSPLGRMGNGNTAETLSSQSSVYFFLGARAPFILHHEGPSASDPSLGRELQFVR
jgi:hypothetical protein